MYVLDLGPPLEEQTTELLSNISPSIMEGEEEDGDHHLHLKESLKYYFTYLVQEGDVLLFWAKIWSVRVGGYLLPDHIGKAECDGLPWG